MLDLQTPVRVLDLTRRTIRPAIVIGRTIESEPRYDIRYTDDIGGAEPCVAFVRVEPVQ